MEREPLLETKVTIASTEQTTEEKDSRFAATYVRQLRRHKTLVHILTLMPAYFLACVCFGLAIAPGVALFKALGPSVQNLSFVASCLGTGILFGVSYFLYGFSMLVVVAFANAIVVGRLQPWRGSYHSAYVVRWYIHNGLTYLLRYTFLEFVTPTPFNILFYKMMGMKIGENVQLNTTQISDPSLIEIGDKVTVGGSAVLIAHYGMKGYLILAPVKIGKGVTVGMRCTIMGAVEIGEYATILPNSLVLPKTTIPAGEMWGGVPAKKIESDKVETSPVEDIPRVENESEDEIAELL